ncbi:uncharacterized protein LAESUDRAFT_764717 [Laetiporus sulphureus 93-53]|uniref:Actin-like ATPase domain-containing protein n=1 Tax=Laetiporus sulphureus 93-53 TaxID=1314785 RepID=A0A165B5P6_9APHY|nr:uncharacterized protein LAESUDRAFT_764717 [Laetiporus sulphureus 93-53]KZT00295.1 hypothetical protein LAESUDRAFT_764717 [Laetiporus sulphureus 93-53]
MSPLQPFRGFQRKLVLAFDVGTTFSGVSYAVLDPDEIPEIQNVTRFPGQENAAGDCKIPSILYYSQDGTVRAAGAEAALPGMDLQAEDENLIYVEWFKLHLRPSSLAPDDLDAVIARPLPTGKTAVDVFGDFLAYLYSCARKHITDSHAGGDLLLSSFGDRIEFVLSHPNGWEGLQQSKMRRAAVLGGLIPDTAAGQGRVHFVTEGEASMYFCIQKGLAANSMQIGQNILIVDAGGGTVDISAYKFVTVAPLSMEEVATPDCILQGSTRVNVRAQAFLQGQIHDTDKLCGSYYGNEEDIKTMIRYFDKYTKPIFKDRSEDSYIKFGSMSCNDPSSISAEDSCFLPGTRGRYDMFEIDIDSLSGSDELASFFEPSIRAIVNAVEGQRRSVNGGLNMVFLVGGFAASPWLFSRLQSSLSYYGLTLARPDRHTSKAVAEGAVAFYLEHWVSVRVMKVTYGVECTVEYDETNPEHRIRRGRITTRPSGRRALGDSFSGRRVRDKEEMYRNFFKESHESTTLDRLHTSITCYRGTTQDPRWTDLEPESFATLCTVQADTSRVTKVQQHGLKGVYYTQHYKVVLLCGLTELKAQISWMENGEEKRGPATVVYDDDAEAIH